MGRFLGNVVVGALAVVVILALYPTPRPLSRAATRAADRLVALALAWSYAVVDAVAARLPRRHRDERTDQS